MKTKRQTKRAARRMFGLCFVNGILDEGRTRAVVQRVIDAKRRDGLALLLYFHHLVKLNAAQHSAEVESATPLPEVLREKIQTGLVRTYGSGIHVTFTHNPRLIGGMRIKVGSDVYDGSIQGRLDEMEKSF
jgi:F-type H+-transporting ATPase subunit delta